MTQDTVRKLISGAKEDPGELKTALRIIGLFCLIWPFAFALQPKRTVKDTLALLRGNYGSDYEPGDPRRWPESK